VEREIEDFIVELNAIVAAVGYEDRIDVNIGSRTINITDNDIAVLAFASDLSAAEGTTSNGEIRFVVNLSKAFDQDMTLDYEVLGLTAAASDIVGGFGTRTVPIPAFATSIEIVITLQRDAALEPDETFSLDLLELHHGTGTPRSYDFDDDHAVGAIENDD
jgi:hypothetical protein